MQRKYQDYFALIFLLGEDYHHNLLTQINTFLHYYDFCQEKNHDISTLYIYTILSAKYFETTGLRNIQQIRRDIILRRSYLIKNNLLTSENFLFAKTKLCNLEFTLLQKINYNVKYSHVYLSCLKIFPFTSQCSFFVRCWKKFLIQGQQVNFFTLILALTLLHRKKRLKERLRDYYFVKNVKIFQKVIYHYDLDPQDLIHALQSSLS